MQNKLTGTIGLAVAVFGLTIASTMGACNSGNLSNPGGTGNGGTGTGAGPVTTGSGGSMSAGTGGSCADVSACGGNLVGTWNVTSSCLRMTGMLDLSFVGESAGCQSAPVTGTLQVTGTWTANTDGTYTDNTVTTGEEHFTLGPACLVISSTPVTCEGAGSIIKSLGYASVTCTALAGNKGCDCSATVHQVGTIGTISAVPSTSGDQSSSGNVVTVSGDAGDSRYAYCVAGNSMTWTPQTMNPPTSGTIVFEKAAAAGTAGSSGGGGTSSSGGSTGSAGRGSAGAAGTSGTAGRGGATGAAGTMGSAGTTGSAGATGGGMGPCDIYQKAGNPCVAAHSTVRALFGAYSGKLYQVRNTAGATKDILTLAPGGIADGLSQDAFCTGTTCVITVLYDQSGKGNDLWYQGSTMVPASTSSTPSKATSESLMVGGHKVYSLYINPNNSYWVDASKSGIALGKDPEAMYMVTNSKHYNTGCCFDYGNSETDRKADGSGAMDALNFSAIPAWGSGAGNGPWVMADLEYGVFAQNNTQKNPNDPSQTSTYVTAVLKNNGTTEFALRGGDAQAGPLGTYYKGALPGGWSPMKKQGAIVLGSGGDCCKPGGGANASDGTFYEGCIVTGYPTDATEDAVQANIVAAGYGK